jgi:hypothetical protein
MTRERRVLAFGALLSKPPSLRAPSPRNTKWTMVRSSRPTMRPILDVRAAGPAGHHLERPVTLILALPLTWRSREVVGGTGVWRPQAPVG